MATDTTAQAGEAAADDTVLHEVYGTVGVIVLNRPRALNALSLEMLRGIHQQLLAWADDPAVHAVLLRGAGDKAFCAGGDVVALHDSFRAGDSTWLRFFEEEYALDLYIAEYPKPCIALMDGYTMGGGMGIAQPASLRIATARTRIAMPEVAIGYFPDVGGSHFLPRLPGRTGWYLGLTGVTIEAADALHAGLADLAISGEEAADTAALAARLSAVPWHLPPADRLASWSDQADMGAAPLAAVQEAVDLHFGQPGVAAIVASLRSETRPAFAPWAQATLALMEKRSPLAMAITWELLRRGEQMPLAECFQMELALDQAWFPRGDVIEGIRAQLVDKDRSPRWNPPTLEGVDEALVQSFFAPAPHG